MAAVGGLTITVATQASATSDTIVPVSWAYTDSRDVAATKTGPDAPVGAWRDGEGKHHLSMSYFTFDISKFAGTRVLDARMSIPLAAATDCAEPRATQAWLTDAETKPTWSAQPAQRAQLQEQFCDNGRTGWKLDTAVRDAVAAGRTQVTIALRVAEEFQGDLAYGRRFNPNPFVTVDFNNPPQAPSVGTECAEYFQRTRPVELRATARDSDYSDHQLSTTFEVWPADRPGERTRLTATGYNWSSVSVRLPDESITEGGTYVWRAQTADGFGAGPWSAECRFTTDFTRPSKPVLTSTDYPDDGAWHGGSGIPGTFHVDAAGAADVVAFQWTAGGAYTTIPADQPGGKASFVWTPTASGPQGVTVWAIDRAGWKSEAASTRVYVSGDHDVRIEGQRQIPVGVPSPLTFKSGATQFVSFTYHVEGGPSTTVQAGPDGTAVAQVVVPNPYSWDLFVHGNTATGQAIGHTKTALYGTMSPPTLSNDVYAEDAASGGPGVASTFTFEPGMAGVVSYYYEIWPSGESGVVEAGPDGKAVLPWTPTEAGMHAVEFSSLTASGVVSDYATYTFTVNP